MLKLANLSCPRVLWAELGKDSTPAAGKVQAPQLADAATTRHAPRLSSWFYSGSTTWSPLSSADFFFSLLTAKVKVLSATCVLAGCPRLPLHSLLQPLPPGSANSGAPTQVFTATSLLSGGFLRGAAMVTAVVRSYTHPLALSLFFGFLAADSRCRRVGAPAAPGRSSPAGRGSRSSAGSAARPECRCRSPPARPSASPS